MDDAKIQKLEQQLQKAMSLIQQQSEQLEEQSKQMDALKTEIENLQISDVGQKGIPQTLNSIEPAAMPAKNMELEERITLVEEAVFELDERTDGETIVNAFDADNFDIGGFINTAYTYVDGEDGSASAFNRQNFELLLRADLHDDWSAFFAGGFIREGNIQFDDDADGNLDELGERRNPEFAIQNQNPQIIAWMNYKNSDAFNIQLGRLITPHGIINIEHFPAALLDQEQPLFLRPFSGDTIFPNFVTGTQVHGSLFFGGADSLSYNAYAAADQSAPEEMLYGGRIAYDFGNQGVEIGLNALTGSRDEGANGDYNMLGADLYINKGPLLWKSEIFTTDESNGEDRFAFYTQPAWHFNDRWIGFYRFDYLDDGIKDGADDGEVTEHMFGINFLPHPDVRTRLTATRREYRSGGGFGSAELDILQFSTTFSF